MSDVVTPPVGREVPAPDVSVLLDQCLPAYDVALTEHVVVAADPGVVFAAAKDFDFLTTNSLLVTALMTVRTVPTRIRRRPVVTPPSLRLARDEHVLPGWVLLGEIPGPRSRVRCRRNLLDVRHPMA